MIDELRFREDEQDGMIRLSPRWPLNWPGQKTSAIPEFCDDSKFGTEILSAARVAIKSQIGNRDYKLVSQSDCVCAFRPYLGGSPMSGGVDKEITYAMSSMKDVLVVHPDEDPQDPAGPLDTYPKVLKFGGREADGLDKMVQHLRKSQTRISRN
jgi:hypothetical protein